MSSAPGLVIRQASGDDSMWLVKVDGHVPQSWVHRCIALHEYRIASAQEQRLGFLRHSMFWGVIPFMDLIYVEPGHRGRGVGSALFLDWQEAMRAAGATMLMTSSVQDEPEPQAWHKRNGFETSGTLNLRAFQATPEVFFVKPLGGARRSAP